MKDIVQLILLSIILFFSTVNVILYFIKDKSGQLKMIETVAASINSLAIMAYAITVSSEILTQIIAGTYGLIPTFTLFVIAILADGFVLGRFLYKRFK